MVNPNGNGWNRANILQLMTLLTILAIQVLTNFFGLGTLARVNEQRIISLEQQAAKIVPREEWQQRMNTFEQNQEQISIRQENMLKLLLELKAKP